MDELYLLFSRSVLEKKTALPWNTLFSFYCSFPTRTSLTKALDFSCKKPFHSFPEWTVNKRMLNILIYLHYVKEQELSESWTEQIIKVKVMTVLYIPLARAKLFHMSKILKTFPFKVIPAKAGNLSLYISYPKWHLIYTKPKGYLTFLGILTSIRFHTWAPKMKKD